MQPFSVLILIEERKCRQKMWATCCFVPICYVTKDKHLNLIEVLFIAPDK